MKDSEPTERTSEPKEMPRAPWRDERLEDVMDPETGIRKVDVLHFHQWMAGLTFEAPKPEIVRAMIDHMAAWQSGKGIRIRSAEAIDQDDPGSLDSGSVASGAPSTTGTDDRPPLARKRNKIAAADAEQKSGEEAAQPRVATQGAANTTKAMAWTGA